MFREGHDKNYFDRELDTLYTLFAIGHLVYGTTYGRLYRSTDEFEQKVNNSGLPWYNRIDASVSETYEMVPQWQRAALFLLSPLFAGLMLGLVAQPAIYVLPRIAPELLSTIAFAGTILTLLCFGFVWAFAYFLLIESRVMYDRDRVMTREIIRTTERNDYESILVTCGANHRQGIASNLRNEGWNVTEKPTDSLIRGVLIRLLVKRIRRIWVER